MNFAALATPRVRLAVGAVWVAGVALLPLTGTHTPVVALGVGLVAALLLRPNLMLLLLRVVALAAFLTLTFLPALLGPQPNQALTLLARTVGAVTVALALAGCFERRELPVALRQLGAPRFIAELVDTALTQLGMAVPLARRLVLARRLRGAHLARASVGAVPELLVRSAQRAERVSLARELRGYHLADKPAPLTRAEWLTLGAGSLAALLPHALV